VAFARCCHLLSLFSVSDPPPPTLPPSSKNEQILLFNLPVNFAQGTSIFWAYVVGFKESPLTAIQVRVLVSVCVVLGRLDRCAF